MLVLIVTKKLENRIELGTEVFADSNIYREVTHSDYLTELDPSKIYAFGTPSIIKVSWIPDILFFSKLTPSEYLYCQEKCAWTGQNLFTAITLSYGNSWCVWNRKTQSITRW